jgi:hypothetical protein
MGKKKSNKEWREDVLKDVCLHCAFFNIHKDKWPDWKPSGDNKTDDAFNDLVRSTIKIVAEVFTMLDPMGQMKFMRRVMETYATSESDAPQTLAELLKVFHATEKTKHTFEEILEAHIAKDETKH